MANRIHAAATSTSKNILGNWASPLLDVELCDIREDPVGIGGGGIKDTVAKTGSLRFSRIGSAYEMV
jgi:hypothetical protein